MGFLIKVIVKECIIHNSENECLICFIFTVCRLEHCVYKCPCMCLCSVWDALTDNYIPSSVSSWDDPASETLNGNLSDQEVNICSDNFHAVDMIIDFYFLQGYCIID